MRILVVEDDRKVARFIQQGLEEEGHAVDVAPDGEAGGLLAHVNPYDVLVLDIQLPKQNGLQLAAELRRERVTVPILMLTARDSTEDVVRGLDAGADDYLTKPFGIEELLARIRVALRHRESMDGKEPPAVSLGEIRVDLAARTVHRGEEEAADPAPVVVPVVVRGLEARELARAAGGLRGWQDALRRCDYELQHRPGPPSHLRRGA